MPNRHFYLLSHYICYSLFFLFSVFWLQVNEFNSMWEDKGENIRSLLLARKVSRPEEKNDILRQYNDKFIYTPSRSAQNHRPPNNVRPAEGYIRISHNLPSPSLFISPKIIEFIPSGAKEQVGYGIISFFVCFSLNEFQILSTFFIEHMDCVSAKCEGDFASDR